MAEAVERLVREPVGDGREAEEVLHLELDVTDLTVVGYLVRFDPAERNAKALEALKVGVIAIQSASPSLDTRIVEEKFQKIEVSIGESLKTFRVELEAYFKVDSGTVPRKIDSLFGKDGEVTRLLNQYFGPDNGRVRQVIERQIGPSSAFAKSLDPESKSSVISVLEKKIGKALEQATNDIVKQLSLDEEGSALARLTKEIRESQADFMADLNKALGLDAGKREEAEKGTEKGREFEVALYDRVAQMGQQLEDSTEMVSGTVGSVKRSKKGDYVITLGETSGAPGRRIVVEAKNQEMKLRDALAEMEKAKENRDAVVGLFAFAEGCSPTEVGDFRRVGDDFYVSVDGKAVESAQPLLYLEVAYKIARVLAVTAARKDEVGELDMAWVQQELDAVVEHARRLSELVQKAKLIGGHARFIEENAQELQTEIESSLKRVLDLIGD